MSRVTASMEEKFYVSVHSRGKETSLAKFIFDDQEGVVRGEITETYSRDGILEPWEMVSLAQWLLDKAKERI